MFVWFGCEKVRRARSKHPKFGVFVLAGRVFRGRAAGGAVLGEYFRANRHCAGLGSSSTPSRPAAVGVCAMRSPLAACRRRVGGLDGVIPPARWRRGLGLERCCCQSADPLDAKHPQTTVLAEWVCTLADSLSGVAWWSHAKPLAGMRTRYVARNSPATT